MIRVLPIAALALTGACAPQERPAPNPPGIECDANKVQDLVGKPRSAALEAEAKRLSGANVVRWLEPNAIVTMEFRADRLNLHLGTDGKIGSARCG